MGDDPGRESVLALVANRVEFVELLAGTGATPPRDIVDELSYSRSTVHRALGDLREANLVEKTGDGYTATLTGVMAAREYRRYETASRAILSAEDLLNPIPEAQAPPTPVLVDAETMLADADVPVRALETVADRVQGADRIRAYLPTLINTHLLWDWHRSVVSTDVDGAAIFDPDLLTVLKGQYPHLLSEMAAAEGFAAFSATGPPYGLLYTESEETAAMTLIVYEETTAIRGILTNDGADAVEWVREELDRLEREASAVTGDLHALSAAVADGMADRRLATPAGGTQDEHGATGEQGADRSLPIDLEADGFVRLSEQYFATHGQASPAVSWRTGFSLSEVRAGHAVDRHDEDGRRLTSRLIEALREGRDHVVLGPPGAGKSTVCMAVACEWEDRGLGPVLYRELGRGSHFESTAQLEVFLRHADGHALVVVEDAVREESNDIFTVMRALDGDPDTSFLLDARTNEWRDAGAFDIDLRLDAYRRSHVETVTVPDLDEAGCERFVDRFGTLVGADVELSGTELFSMIHEGGSIDEEDTGPGGDALLVQHSILQRYDPLDEETASARSALTEDVRQTHRRVADAEPSLAPTLAVLVAVLTAASVPVAREYLYAVAADTDEFQAVETAIDRLEGLLLFEQEGSRVGGPSTYRTRHEKWATHYLEYILDLDPDHRAVDLVTHSVTDLLALADQPDRRRQLVDHLDGGTPHLHRVETDPQAWADELVDRIFRVGRRNGTLAPLFGETGDGEIELPASASPWTRLQLPYWRGLMNRTRGDLDRAEREFRTLGQRSLQVDLPEVDGSAPPTPAFTSPAEIGTDDQHAHRSRWRAASRTNLGLVARDRGNYDAAEEYHMEALELCREIGDRGGVATNRQHLGFNAYFRSDYEQAREYLTGARDIAAEITAPRIQAASSNHLGLVASERGEYEQARAYQEECLDIARDIDDGYWKAAGLGGLGETAIEQGAYAAAREYTERSLAIARDFGFKYGETTFLNNLGVIARKQGALDDAREFHEESLAINRAIGADHGIANTHKNLGIVERQAGRFDVAEDHLDRAIAALEGTDDRGVRAEVRFEEGRLALAADDVETARERARTARETFEALGARHWEGRSHHLLGRVARRAGDPENAVRYCQTALEIFEAVGAAPDALATLQDLITTARSVGDDEPARDWASQAEDLLADAPEPTREQHGEWVERQVGELHSE